MKNKKYFILIPVFMMIGLFIFFFQRNPYVNRAYLFEKENETELPGSYIIFTKDRLVIIEIVNKDEDLATIKEQAQSEEEYQLKKELIRLPSREIHSEYTNYRIDKKHKMITADGLEDPITMINDFQLSYKGNVYTRTEDMKIESQPIK